VGGLVVLARLSGQEPKPVAPEDPVHNELRALRDSVLEAFNKNDLDKLLTYVHKNVVATWQNGEVSRGHQGIRDYYNRMMVGEKRVVDSVQAQVQVDELTILYGKTNGIAFGHMDEDFKLRDGRDFLLPNRWTAAVVKEDGKWLISAFHVSANIFDNPVLHIAIRRTAVWTGLLALLAGVLLGLITVSLVRRMRRRPT
jgi:ketosteroid isomerase-like protein